MVQITHRSTSPSAGGEAARIDTIQNERLGNPAAVREGDGGSGGGVCVSSWIVDPDKEEAGGAANHTVADATAVHHERN